VSEDLSVEHAYAKPPEEVLRELGTDPENGLDASSVKQMRERYGSNELREEERRSAWRILLDQFKSIVILIMAGAAVVAFATGRLPEGIALVGVTVVNTLIGFFSEWRAVRSMEALRQLGAFAAKVRRGGEDREVPADDVVVGDLVRLEPEELVPADLRLLEADQLRVNEAALTGESVPVNKTVEAVDEETTLAERTSMAYKGTTVSEGEGLGIVVASGMDTQLGRISQLAHEAEGEATPLQKRLDNLGRRMAWVVLGIAAVLAVTGLLAGRDLVRTLETSIALGVAAVPEGLPIVATIALARGMWLMARRHAIVNRLTSVETLGATRVIFTDKTGTLTENRMSVTRVVTPEGDHELGNGSPDPDEASPLLTRAIRIGVLCNNAELRDDHERGGSGDPTEVALLEAGVDFGLPRKELLEKLPEEREESFDPDTMMMATIHAKEDHLLVAVKGAPEAVLPVCARIAAEREERGLEDEERGQWLERADQLAGEGLRLLAVADKEADTVEEEPYGELCFVGVLGLADPPRNDVRDAIEECQRAGIRVVMVTGDRPDTGRVIGEQVGLEHADTAVRGGELEESREDWGEDDRRRLLETDVFARVTPEQKLELVRLYQEQGEIVAMTGDGVNDAPALKQADIGVAMGRRGTDAPRASLQGGREENGSPNQHQPRVPDRPAQSGPIHARPQPLPGAAGDGTAHQSRVR